jgi:hypothetical protein
MFLGFAISQWLSTKLQDMIIAAGNAETYEELILHLAVAVRDNPHLIQKMQELSKTFLAHAQKLELQMGEEVMHELPPTQYVHST